MSAATSACQSVAYHGEQMIVWRKRSGSTSAYLIKVWHEEGAAEISLGAGDLGTAAVPSAPASDSYAKVSMLSVWPWMLSLMRANYLVEYVGVASASGRRANVVVLRREDGTLAARYWLDQVTGLPLRREVFDVHGHLVNEGVFVDLTVGDADPQKIPAPRAPAWEPTSVTSGAARVRKRGWPVPRALAGNMSLVTLTHSVTKSGPVVDASYSDGLSVVSVFLQRGRLPKNLSGWRRDQIAGYSVYVNQSADGSVTWSAQGFVYTVIADASGSAVSRIVATLPHERKEAFWQRVDRGLRRITSLVDPFG